MKLNRLWIRLTLAFIFVALISAAAVAGLATISADNQFRQYVARRDVLAQSGVLDSLTAYFETNSNWNGVESVLAQFSGRGQGRGRPPLLLADATGRVVYDERNLRAGTALSDDERDSALPIDVQGVTTGYLLLGAQGRGTLAANEQNFLDQLQHTLIVAALASSALGVAIGIVISRTVSRPLAQLAQAARMFAAHRWDQRVEVHGTQEMTEVSHAFNDMADSLQRAELLRRNLMADVAHELRTPLTVLQGNLRAILDGVYPLEHEEIATLYDETRLLNRLVDDLRELALAEAGQLRLNVQPIDLGAIIETAVANFATVAETQNIAVTLKHDEELPVVRADADRVAQVLRNLMGNALRHTPNGGAITLEVGSLQSEVRIAVRDTGEGIAPEDLPHVFDRFYRSDKSRARHSGGSGLGLAIAKALIDTQGGQIGVESTIEQGSCFWFTLPCVTE